MFYSDLAKTWKILLLSSVVISIWAVSLNNELESNAKLPTIGPNLARRAKRNLPKQDDKKAIVLDEINTIRRQKIVNMTLHGWNGYKQHAWGWNELKPVSRRENHQQIFGYSRTMGATIIDSLDTLYLMGLTAEFNEASTWIRQNFNINVDSDMSLFEINIRIIGGLLSTFTFTNQRFYLDKAVEVANSMLPAFNTPTGIPINYFNPTNQRTVRLSMEYGSCTNLAELGTLSLEFLYLTDLTGNQIYEEKVNRIYATLNKTEKVNGIYFDNINPTSGLWCSSHASLAGLSDSFYEYLFKVWMYKSRRDPALFVMFSNAIKAVKHSLIKRSKGLGLIYAGEYPETMPPKMDHLACFSGGLFALIAMYGPKSQAREHEQLAIELTRTCRLSYEKTNTKLGPESFHLDAYNELKPANPAYLLRPETIESYFYLWRMTGDQKYREWAWEAALAIDTYCYTGSGYSGIRNVNSAAFPVHDDVQQSYFFAETLKYLYLIFSDEKMLPLDKYVFNTEGHPFRVRDLPSFSY